MKSWFDSRWILGLGLLLATPAVGAPDVGAGFACLERVDVACARRVADQLMDRDPDDAGVRSLAAHTAFFEGDYAAAVDLLEGLGPVPEEARASYEEVLNHFRDTLEATSGFVEVRRGGIVVRYAPGVDAVLVDEAVETLQAARSVLSPILGGLPPQPVLVEIYPDTDRFVMASSLGEQAVATTGVVALSKWSRLLVTSPRALARGYAWKDTLVHEYVHLLVSYVSHDLAPVWLQEGIARHLETWWRGESDAPLRPYDQSLLARALADGNLVSFEEMHPSFAFLATAERGVLAYAQVKMLVREAMVRGGPGTLQRTLERVREGREAQDALAEAAGYESFQEMFQAMVATLRGLDLVERRLAALPLAREGEDEFAADPLLARRRDLADHARLGDLLREAGRPRAALVEYDRARAPEEPSSPLISNRVAACRQMLGERAAALEVLRQSAEEYPEFALTWKSIGALERALGRPRAALEAYALSADVNPFDPDVQGALAELLEAEGQEAAAERHRQYRRILLTGGGLQ